MSLPLQAHIAKLGRVPESSFREDTPLFSSGILDSMNLLDLVRFVESFYGIRIGPADMSLRNLDSIAQIKAYVARSPS
jgi:acyl carrier protein